MIEIVNYFFMFIVVLLCARIGFNFQPAFRQDPHDEDYDSYAESKAKENIKGVGIVLGIACLGYVIFIVWEKLQ